MTAAARSAAAALLLFGLWAGAARGEGQPSRTELDALLAATDDIAATVSTLRGLPVSKKITRSVMSRAQVTERILLRMNEEQSEAEVRTEERILKRLGLAPADQDLKALVVDLLSEQIAGFYDPEVTELYIADWIDVDTQRMVMAHEIDHALQDQAFDLTAFMKGDEHNGDAALAKQALVEGDGVALMIEFLFLDTAGTAGAAALGALWANDTVVDSMIGAASSGSAGEKFDAAPLFLRESLMFPYMAGLRFVAAARRQGDWSKIDAMFRSPPASTEQILHPQLYAKGELPRRITAGAPSLAKHKQLYVNVLGELMFGLFLREHGVAADRARAAAAGWGGDRIVGWVPSADGKKRVDDVIVVSLSVWDDETEAIEAFAAVREVVRPLTGAKRLDASGTTYVAAQDASGDVTFAERRGTRILLVVGAPAKQAERIRTDVPKQWKID